MTVGTLDSKWTKIMNNNWLCVWPTSRRDRNVGLRFWV